MIVAVILALGLAVAAIGGVLWAVHLAIARTDRAAASDVRAAELTGANATLTATADTADRLRKAETARADALEEELSDADQAALDHPDAGARRRVLSRWRDAARAAGGDGARPVSDPSEVDAPGGADADR